MPHQRVTQDPASPSYSTAAQTAWKNQVSRGPTQAPPQCP